MVNLPKFRFLKFRLFLLSLKGRVSPAMADLINEVRWSRGIGPSPGHLAATDEEELPEMPTVTHAFPTAARRRRRPCGSPTAAKSPKLVVAGFGTVGLRTRGGTCSRDAS